MATVIGIFELIIIVWLLAQVNRIEASLRNMAKNLEILTQNQRAFFINQMSGKEQLQDPEQIKEEAKSRYKIN